MAAFTWTASAGGNWNLGTNWDPNAPLGQPGSGDVALIENEATPYTVTVNASDAASSLIFANPGGSSDPGAPASSVWARLRPGC